MTHNFEQSLQNERSKADFADKFYTERFRASDIVRYNSDSDIDMDFQRKDIDVSLVIDGKRYYLSEKFREKDYGDMYLEMYSKYPKTQGWMDSGSPDVVVYFTPQAVYRIIFKELQSFCLETLFPQIPAAWLQEIYNSRKTIVSKTLPIDNFPVRINLIQAHNKPTTGSSWATIGISIPFDVLRKFGVKIRKYETPTTVKDM